MPRELVNAVDSGDYLTIRRLLLDGASPDVPHLGLLPLPVAVEKADIACVALLLHYHASPDMRPSSGTSTAREYAQRMFAGEHADTRSRAGRQALSYQHEAAARILRLFDAPAGDESCLLYTAFTKRLDALEEEERQREMQRYMVAGLTVVVVFLLYISGLLGHFGERDRREL